MEACRLGSRPVPFSLHQSVSQRQNWVHLHKGLENQELSLSKPAMLGSGTEPRRPLPLSQKVPEQLGLAFWWSQLCPRWCGCFKLEKGSPPPPRPSPKMDGQSPKSDRSEERDPHFPESHRDGALSHPFPMHLLPPPLFPGKAGIKMRRQETIRTEKQPAPTSSLRIPRKHVPYKYMSSVINSHVPFRGRSNCLALLGTTDTSKPRALCSATWSSAWGYLFSLSLFFFLVKSFF